MNNARCQPWALNAEEHSQHRQVPVTSSPVYTLYYTSSSGGSRNEGTGGGGGGAHVRFVGWSGSILHQEILGI